MTNDTTRAMPTVKEIEAMASRLNELAEGEPKYAMENASDMLRAIANQMRESEPTAWMMRAWQARTALDQSHDHEDMAG